MPRAASSKIDKIEHPQSHHATPDELIEDRPLSFEENAMLSRSGNKTRVKCSPPATKVWRAARRGSIRAIIMCLARSSAPRTNCNARQNRRCRAGAAKVPNTFISRGIAALVPSP